MLCERAIIINQGQIAPENEIADLGEDNGAKRLEEKFMAVVSADRAAEVPAS